MTETAKRLRRLGLPHARARAAATLLVSAGIALAIAAAGLWLAPRAPVIAVAWLGIAAVGAFAVWAVRRAGRGVAPQVVGPLLEKMSNARAGSVVGTLAPGVGASAELFALADARAAGTITAAAPQVHRILARGTRRHVVAGALVASAGAALFVAASPASGRAAFWHPLRTIAERVPPCSSGGPHERAARDTVSITIDAAASTEAILWLRGLGEAGGRRACALDSAGRAVRE